MRQAGEELRGANSSKILRTVDLVLRLAGRVYGCVSVPMVKRHLLDFLNFPFFLSTPTANAERGLPALFSLSRRVPAFPFKNV